MVGGVSRDRRRLHRLRVALATGLAGLYQVAIQVPASLADGDYPVIASVSGQQSPIASDPQASESKDALRTRNAWARLSLAGRT